VCELRRAHPRWGARRIAFEVAQRGTDRAPSRGTVHQVLERNGMVVPQAQRHKRKYKRWEQETPTALWQLDLVGGIYLADGRRAQAAVRHLPRPHTTVSGGAWRAPPRGCPRIAGASVPGDRELVQGGRDSFPHRVQGLPVARWMIARVRSSSPWHWTSFRCASGCGLRWQSAGTSSSRPWKPGACAQRGGAGCDRAVIRSQCPGNPLPPGLRSMHLASYRSDVSTRYIAATGRHVVCRRRRRQPDVQRAVV
jgi:hypothetical protein